MNTKGLSIVLILLFSAVALSADGPAKGSVQLDSDRASGPVLTLDAAVLEALRQNPAVQSAMHAAMAQRSRVPQAKALPDPTVGIGWMGNIRPFSVQTGDPSSYRSVSAMQMVPYPGKLRLRGEMAAKEADGSKWDVEAARRRVTADVKMAYFDYWYYDKALRTTSKNKDLLSKLSEISQARYRVGKGLQQDVLKSQVETSMLLQKLTVLEQQRSTAQARLNTLMARDPDAPLPPPAELSRQAPLNYSLQDLYKLARQNDSGYQLMQTAVERDQIAAAMAREEYYPDLSVGYMYEQRPMLPDMHGLTFTVNVPVFYRSKQREQVTQAREEQLSAERARDNRKNELYFELKQNYLAAKASNDLLDLFSQAVVPQSSLALESSMSAYQAGNVDFLTVLGNFTTVLNYEINYYQELANYQAALARMESLVGVELTSETLSPAPPVSSPDAGKGN